ncbi:MAG TPA: hypothetical protein VMW75_13570, partial [Thermoanaerobaculia bacterium]|nr:hypothetical protein [Thermoanaerobaculia bacterium]
GVPAITPRSPLESLGAGGAGGAAADAGEAMHGALSETAHGALSEAAGDGLSTGHHFDPLAQVAAALPPLDELAPDVPALPPLDELVAGVSAPPPAPAAAPGATAPAAAAPAFSAFDLRTPRRRSRLPLIAALLAVALAGLAVYLLRDTALAWIEGREAAQAPARPVAPAGPAAPAPAAGGAGPRGPRSPADRQAAAASSSTGAVQSPAGGPNAGVGQPPAPGAGATAAGKVAGTPAAAGAATSPARGGGTAPVHTGAAASQAAAAPPAAASSSTPPGAGVSPAGRAVLEPLAPAGNGRGAGAPAGARLTSVLRITFQPVADGTEVVLWGNGEFPSQSYTHVRVSGLPVREVIRINGIDRPFPSPRLAVRTPELLQIRTGYHPPQELHVVLDLGSRDVQVTGFEPGPRQLRIHLRAR